MKRISLATELWLIVRSRWRVIVPVLLGVALASAYSTMLNVPGAEIIDALDADKYRIHWISGGYVLGSALGMALTKFCASRFGLRRSYLVGLLLFTLASGACGFANDIVVMAPLRWINGLGNGLLISTGMILIWKALPRHREFAMAIYGMAVFVPATAGSVIGGLLTAWQSWRLIFLINLPLGAMALLLASWYLPAEPKSKSIASVKFDAVGVGLLLATIVTISVVLVLGQYWGWSTSRQFSLWLIGFVLAGTGFVFWGLWAKQPVVDFRVFARRNTALGLLVKILFSINLYSLAAMLSVYMIDLRGYQWWQAALVMSSAVATMILSIGLGLAVGRDSNRKLRMLVGLAVMILCTWQLTALDLYTSKFWLAAVLAVFGGGAGLVIGPALMTIFARLPIDETMTLAGVFNICRELPAYVALVALTTLWTRSADAHFDTLRQNIEFNRPVVSATYDNTQQHFIQRGSPRSESLQQSQALISKWTQANARAFALENTLRDLTWMTLPALVCVLLVKPAHPRRLIRRTVDRTAQVGGGTRLFN